VEAASERSARYATAAGNTVVVQGHSGYLFVPIVFIPAIAVGAFTYYRDNLPSFCIENADKVLALTGIVTLALIVAALFMRSRRVELRGGELHYHSWITDRTLRTEAITAVTFETEISGGESQSLTEHYLTLWSDTDTLLRFNFQRWPRTGLRALLNALRERQPSLRMDLAVERYLSSQV
jgi:hypothetical protein